MAWPDMGDCSQTVHTPHPSESASEAAKAAVAALHAEVHADASRGANGFSRSSLPPQLRREIDLASVPVDFLEAYPYPAFVLAYSVPSVSSNTNGGCDDSGRSLSRQSCASSTTVYHVLANSEWDKHGYGRSLLDMLEPDTHRLLCDWVGGAHEAMLRRMANKTVDQEMKRAEAADAQHDPASALAALPPTPSPTPPTSLSPPPPASLAPPRPLLTRSEPLHSGTSGTSSTDSSASESQSSLSLEITLYESKLRFDLICTPLQPKKDCADSRFRLAIVTTAGRPRFVSLTNDSIATSSRGSTSRGSTSRGSTSSRGSHETSTEDIPTRKSNTGGPNLPPVFDPIDTDKDKALTGLVRVEDGTDGNAPDQPLVWTEVCQVLENMRPWKPGEAVWHVREEGTNGTMRPVVNVPSHEISVARLLEEFPFEQTPLGPRSSWDSTLHVLNDILQANPMSGMLWVGRELTTIYNQPMAEIMPDHPQLWGQYGDAAAAELQAALGPLTEVVYAGIPVIQQDELFMSKYNKNANFNEMYGTQMWLPIRNVDGDFGGLYNGIMETTKLVVGERRNLLLKTAAELAANARSVDEFDKCTLEALASDPKDVPFALLFHVDNETSSIPETPDSLASQDVRRSRPKSSVRLRYAGGVGVPEGHPSAPAIQTISLLSPVEMVMTEQFPPPSTNGTANGTANGSTEPESPSGSPTRPRRPRPPRSPSITVSETPNGELNDWPFVEAIRTRKPVLMKDCAKLIEGYPVRVWKRLPSSAIVMPVAQTLDNNQLPKALLVMGISSRQSFDDDYESFVHSLRLILSSSLISAEGTEADRHRIESLASLDRAKSLLFSNVFNELFSPLSLIAGPLEDVIMAMGDDCEWRDSLLIAQRNVRRLTGLVSMITEVSALESDCLSRSFTLVNLGVVTRDLAAVFRKAACTAGLDFLVDCDTTPHDVYVDREQWEKIVFNIIGNALKHTREGTIKVTLRYTSSEAVFAVEDTGVGIPASDVVLIERNVNEAQQGDGAGIVLTFTKKLIQLHQGTFEVESRTSEESADGSSGTICRVRIRLGRDHLMPAQINPSSATPPLARRGSVVPCSSPATLWADELEGWDRAREYKKSEGCGGGGGDGKLKKKRSFDANMLLFSEDDTIMVVDDLADSRRYIRSIFEDYCRVVEARDGQEALAMWNDTQPDLVIADYHMPRLGGKALLKALRTGRPEQKLVPFIMLMPAGVPRAVGDTYTADDYLLKPFNARELLSRAHMQLQIGKKRIALEKMFNERTAELRVLTDLSPVGIYRTDDEGYVTYANPAWYKLAGYPMGEPVRNWGDYVHERDKVDVRNAWETYLRTGAEMVETEYGWVNGNWVATKTLRLDRITDNLTGSIGSAVDMTERKLREELQRQRVAEAEQRRAEAEDAKEQQELLIDITSHEIRNPISSLMQCSSLVKTNMLMLLAQLQAAKESTAGFHPTEQLLLTMAEDLEALDSIYQCGLTQERISNDVLSLGRIQLNMLQMFDVETDIVKEAQKVMSMFQSEARMKQINLEIAVGKGFERLGSPTYTLDPVRLGQIITNLISNAIRFTADSPIRNITLSVDAHVKAPSSGTCAVPEWDKESENVIVRPLDRVYLYFTVRDTGPGLTESEHETIFQRFSQASAKIHTQFGGSGLGLFVSRKISELMGGRIEVLSTVGLGSEFRFFIEAHVPPGAIPAELPHRPKTPLARKAAKKEIPKLRILVAEDNLINRTVLLRQLKHVGMDTDYACNGQEALDKIRLAMALGDYGVDADAQPPAQTIQPFDAVLMDLEMPIMDGYTATRLVREDEAAGKLALSTIIALTGNARQAMIETVMTDFTDVVIKPYRLDDLLQKINKHRAVVGGARPQI